MANINVLPAVIILKVFQPNDFWKFYVMCYIEFRDVGMEIAESVPYTLYNMFSLI
jgi:hypothetical protein